MYLAICSYNKFITAIILNSVIKDSFVNIILSNESHTINISVVDTIQRLG